MSYVQLKVPTTDISEFETYRYVCDDQVEVIFCRGESDEYESYIFETMGANLDPLKLWLREVGVWPDYVERFTDLIWNWRRLQYDLETHRVTIPKSQEHPLDEESPINMPFRVPRPGDRNKDLFDPLPEMAQPGVF